MIQLLHFTKFYKIYLKHYAGNIFLNTVRVTYELPNFQLFHSAASIPCIPRFVVLYGSSSSSFASHIIFLLHTWQFGCHFFHCYFGTSHITVLVFFRRFGNRYPCHCTLSMPWFWGGGSLKTKQIKWGLAKIERSYLT